MKSDPVGANTCATGYPASNVSSRRRSASATLNAGASPISRSKLSSKVRAPSAPSSAPRLQWLAVAGRELLRVENGPLGDRQRITQSRRSDPGSVRYGWKPKAIGTG